MRKVLISLTTLVFLVGTYACGCGCGSCDRGELPGRLYLITYMGCNSDSRQGAFVEDENGAIHIECCTGIVSVTPMGG